MSVIAARWYRLFLIVASGFCATAGAAPLDGVWTVDLGGGATVVLVLQERADGRLLGYLPGDPATRISGGSRSGSAVTINLATVDPKLTSSGVFTGTLSGATLSGTFDDGSGAFPLTLSSATESYSAERWLLADSVGDETVRAGRIRRADGSFASGGFVNRNSCMFIACGGNITGWSVTGAAHEITTSSSGGCSSSTTLSGTFDAAARQLDGSYTTTHCFGGASGAFFGGKEGVSDSLAISLLLQTLAQLADNIEAESPAAADAFASFYLHDGLTKTDWQSRLADMYAAYNNLQVQIDGVRHLISYNDGEVHPFVQGPPRVEWHLIVTGDPVGGGPRVTVADVLAAPIADESLYWLGEEAGRTVFVGNGYSEPFSIRMPVAAGDTAGTFMGLWPYGVHGGGHPEGHPGWDVEYAAGASVRAAADGKVTDIRPNSHHPGLWSVMVEHRPGYRTVYDEIGVLEPGVAVGTVLAAGTSIGTPGAFTHGPDTYYQIHFGVMIGDAAACPGNYLNTAGRAVFDGIWPGARYMEELVEPRACNPMTATFPLVRGWAYSGPLPGPGAMPWRIEFVRPSATTSVYEYRLYDAVGVLLESGTVSHLNPFAAPHATINLAPAGGGATRYGIYEVVGENLLRIAWGASPPADLSAASEYAPEPAAAGTGP